MKGYTQKGSLVGEGRYTYFAKCCFSLLSARTGSKGVLSQEHIRVRCLDDEGNMFLRVALAKDENRLLCMSEDGPYDSKGLGMAHHRASDTQLARTPDGLCRRQQRMLQN